MLWVSPDADLSAVRKKVAVRLTGQEDRGIILHRPCLPCEKSLEEASSWRHPAFAAG